MMATLMFVPWLMVTAGAAGDVCEGSCCRARCEAATHGERPTTSHTRRRSMLRAGVWRW